MNKNKEHGIILFLVLFAAVFVTVFSFSTSPLYGFHDHNDSGVYLLLGKMWWQGYLPYVDYWELKGPVIFFINAIGYWLTSSRYGVYFIQIVFMTISLVGLYKISRLSLSRSLSIFGIIFFFVCLFNIYEAGNLIEEYTIPLLVFCWYYQYKWINGVIENRQIEHSPWHAAFYGFVFAFCLLTRLTDALGLCGGVVFITILLLVKRRYKNLGWNILAFMGGFCVLCIPFILYFHKHDALYEMWYGTFIFGFSYATSSVHSMMGGGGINTFFRSFVDVYCCMIIGVLVIILNRRRWLAGLWMFSIGVMLWWWLVNSNGFGHYGMLAVSYSSLILVEAYRLIKESEKKSGCYAAVGLLSVYILMVGSKDLMIAQVTSPYPIGTREAQFDKVFELIPQQDFPFVTVYQAAPYFYLKYNVTPCYKYPACIDFLWSMDEKLDIDMTREFASCRAKWLVMDREKLPVSHIDFLLEKRYSLINIYENIYLYKRID